MNHVSRTQYSFFIHLCPAERNTISQFDVDIEDFCNEGAGHQVGKYKKKLQTQLGHNFAFVFLKGLSSGGKTVDSLNNINNINKVGSMIKAKIQDFII